MKTINGTEFRNKIGKFIKEVLSGETLKVSLYNGSRNFIVLSEDEYYKLKGSTNVEKKTEPVAKYEYLVSANNQTFSIEQNEFSDSQMRILRFLIESEIQKRISEKEEGIQIVKINPEDDDNNGKGDE